MRLKHCCYCAMQGKRDVISSSLNCAREDDARMHELKTLWRIVAANSVASSSTRICFRRSIPCVWRDMRLAAQGLQSSVRGHAGPCKHGIVPTRTRDICPEATNMQVGVEFMGQGA